jgi:hypothetical protein
LVTRQLADVNNESYVFTFLNEGSSLVFAEQNSDQNTYTLYEYDIANRQQNILASNILHDGDLIRTIWTIRDTNSIFYITQEVEGFAYHRYDGVSGDTFYTRNLVPIELASHYNKEWVILLDQDNNMYLLNLINLEVHVIELLLPEWHFTDYTSGLVYRLGRDWTFLDYQWILFKSQWGEHNRFIAYDVKNDTIYHLENTVPNTSEPTYLEYNPEIINPNFVMFPPRYYSGAYYHIIPQTEQVIPLKDESQEILSTLALSPNKVKEIPLLAMGFTLFLIGFILNYLSSRVFARFVSRNNPLC